jgi:hypothetical protein
MHSGGDGRALAYTVHSSRELGYVTSAEVDHSVGYGQG